MKSFSPALQDLIDAFKQLPGIGIKSAQRIVFHLLKENENKALFLADSIQKSFESINECQECRMYTEDDLCSICINSDRDKHILCIVESPADLIAIENTMQYNGLYFVLMGRLSPIDGVTPENLGIPMLIDRITKSEIKEIIIATSPTVEGDATSFYINDQIKDETILVSRIAYGVPMGGELEYVDNTTLSRAIQGRRKLD